MFMSSPIRTLQVAGGFSFALALIPAASGAASPPPPPTIGSVTLSASPLACAPPDVAVWISISPSGNVMTPLTAASAGKGNGGYGCAFKIKVGAPGKFGLTAWTGPSGAQCGAGKVAAFNPNSSAFFESGVPEFTQSGQLYTCETMLLALGGYLGQSIGVASSATLPTCGAGDVPVRVTKYANPGHMVPVTTSNADLNYNALASTNTATYGYTCATKAQAAKFIVAPFRTSTSSTCGAGDKVVGYSVTYGTGLYNGSTNGVYYDSPQLGLGDAYTCQSLAVALGWKRYVYVPTPVPTVASCPGDLAVRYMRIGTAFMFLDLTAATGSNLVSGGIGCLKALTTNAGVAYFPQPHLNSQEIKCGSDSVVGYVAGQKPGGVYYQLTDPRISRAGFVAYNCMTLVRALGWTPG